jgi:hypothetical protein
MMPTPAVLFMAHPGHEVLVHGWVSHARPVVHVLTDGSGRSTSSRIASTRDALRAVGAPEGTIFGRFTDREIYAAILARDLTVLTALVAELAEGLVAAGATTAVADAAEGYNPVHDLCRAIVGGACEIARRGGARVRHYEYAVVDRSDAASGTVDAYELDERAFSAKIAAARRLSPLLGDVDALLGRFGDEAFRRETFRLVDDWTVDAVGSGERPRYEGFGEARVAAGVYPRVIRRAEHMVPLRAALREWVESTCVS